MEQNEALTLVDTLLPEGAATELQREIVSAMWSGSGYSAVAEKLGYDHDYVRAVAARMLRQIGAALGCEISKRSFRGLLEARFSTASERSEGPLFPGGPLPVGSSYYVDPPDLLHARIEIEKPGAMVLVRAPRRRGKSSFLLRLADHAESNGMLTLTVDFRQLDAAVLADSGALLNLLVALIGERTGARTRDRAWDETIGTKLGCFRYLDTEAFARLDRPMLILLEGVDRLFEFSESAGEFLPFVRSCYEEARHNPRFGMMRLALAYTTEMLVPLELHSSPFNVGFPVRLPDLSAEQIARLATLYLPQARQPEVKELTRSLLDLTGGHPYLVQVALFQGRAIGGATWTAAVLHDSGVRESLFGSHLRAYQSVLEEHPRLVEGLSHAAAGQPVDTVVAWQLERLGLVRREGARVVPSCRLYAEHLAQAVTS